MKSNNEGISIVPFDLALSNKQELAWLLSSNFPEQLEEILNQLEITVLQDLFSTLIPSETNSTVFAFADDDIQGNLQIDKYKLTRCEIFITWDASKSSSTLPGTPVSSSYDHHDDAHSFRNNLKTLLKGGPSMLKSMHHQRSSAGTPTPASVTIRQNSNCTILLESLHQVYNQLLDMTIQIKDYLAVLKETKCFTKNLMEFEALVFRLTRDIALVKDLLLSPTSIARFPEKVLRPNLFNPALPEDVIVEFFMDRGKLVLCVSKFKAITGNAEAKSGCQYFRFNNRTVEMVNQSFTLLNLPLVEPLLQNIRDVEVKLFDMKTLFTKFRPFAFVQ